MSVPLIPVQVNLPPRGNQPVTYGDWLERMNCSCVAGALVMPSPIFSGIFNLADLLSDLLKFMGVFTSIYKIIAKILKVIGCIMDFICAIPNPIKMIKAAIIFFMICLPELLELFPFFAFLLFLLCLIKILISIIVYIMTVLIPLILDIIENITDIAKAIKENDPDGYLAIAFKIVSLFDELRSILALLALLMPIIEMLMSLLAMAMGLPCKKDDKEEDPECPSVFDQMEYSGNDGKLIALYGPGGPLDYKIYFTVEENKNLFKQLKDFFPHGVKYDEISSVDDSAYSVVIDNSEPFIITKMKSNGTMILRPLEQEENTDGYFSSVVMVDGYKTNISNPFVRFAAETGGFTEDLKNKYIEVIDSRISGVVNGGVWEIVEVYDDKNIKLTLKDDEGQWENIPDTLSVSEPFVYWNLVPILPSSGINKEYTLTINHAELIRCSMIGIGCHPAIQAAIQATSNRFPGLTEEMPPASVLPDVASAVKALEEAVSKVAPKDMDVQYVVDNYQDMGNKINDLYPEIKNILDGLKDSCLNNSLPYVLPRVISQEKSSLVVTPYVQFIGEPININVFAYDVSGERLGKGLPPGSISATINSTEGNVSEVQEVLGSNGLENGEFVASLNSSFPTKAQITAAIMGKPISYFNGAELVPVVVDVEFVEPVELARRQSEQSVSKSNEPLGSGYKE